MCRHNKVRQSMKINTQNQTDFQNRTYTQRAKRPQHQSFNGVGDALTNALTVCDAHPMVGVSVIDAATSIVPRTIVDAQTHHYAALETFRRESSGLIVNCLLPSFIVLGIAKLINNGVMGDKFKHLKMSGIWANQDSIEHLSSKFEQAGKSTQKGSQQHVREYVSSVLNSVEGFDTDHYKKFSDIDLSKEVQTLTECITNKNANTSKTINQVYKSIVDKTKAAETLRIDGKSSRANLSSLLRDVVAMGKKFTDKEVLSNMSGFKKHAIKLLNTKSLLGMGVIIPLAVSVQPINRAITHKLSGVKGAPIYKDFTDKDKKQVETNKENLFAGKMKSAGLLAGLTVLSSLKMPSLKMFQFEGLFPTMDQCRWISTATFVSRVFAAEDKNELRETTIRDALTYSSLYFLGDYVSKGVATVMEKVNPKVKLLNRTVDDKNMNIFGKMKNWVSNTKLKSFDEVRGQSTKNLRSICQISHLGVAMVLLGVVFPKMLRKHTEKNREKEIQALKEQEKQKAEQETSPKIETKQDDKKVVIPQQEQSIFKTFK